MNDNPERLAMRFETEDRNGTMYFIVRPMQVVDDERPDAFLPNGERAPSLRNVGYGHPLNDLEIRTWIYRNTLDGGKREHAGMYVEYVSPSSVDARRAEQMLTTLRKINRALERDAARDGEPAHLGQLMIRVARALGIKESVRRTDNQRHTSWLTEMTWRTGRLIDLSNEIESAMRTYLQTGELAA